MELAGGVRVDVERRVVERTDGRRDRLTALEAAVLAYLWDRAAPVTRDELLTEVWGYAPGVLTRAVDSTIHRLRTKIEVDPAAPELLLTLHGSGYLLVRAAAPVPEARVNVPREEPTPVHPLGQHRIDLARARVEGPDGAVPLTSNEIAVLSALIDAAGAAVDRDALQRRVWGTAAGRALESTVSRLRRKIEPDPSHPQHLVTTAAGYRLERGAEPAPVSEPPASTLPGEVDARFGREAEVEAIVDRATRGDRVITLVGPGGVGKTRLAVAAAQALERSGRSARWVDLSEVRSAERMVAAVELALGLRPAGLEPLVRALGSLGPKVVVLDNLEQLLPEGAAVVGALAAASAEGVWLVTSRLPLRIRGERRFPVGPLPPEDAADLFVDRSARPPGPAERALVLSLVGALDGLPLAVELAAARTAALSVAEIGRRAHESLRLLTTTDPTRPGRHRSLRASIDASWALLGEGARVTFCQLVVFAGTFSLEACEQVVELPAEAWIVDALQELVDAGMVRHAGPERYRVQVALQEYALEQVTADALAEAEVRHGAWFARLGSVAALAELAGPMELELRRALSLDADNLWVATERALDRRDAAVAVPCARAAWEVTQSTGATATAASWPRRLLELVTDDRVGQLAIAARIEEATGRSDGAFELYRAAAEAIGPATPPGEAAAIHNLIAGYHLAHEDLGAGEASAGLGLQLARVAGDGQREAWALTLLGRAARHSGRLERAREWLDRAMEVAERVGSAGRTVEILRELAVLPGPPAVRDALLARASRIARDRGDLTQEGDVVCAMWMAEHRRYHLDAAPALEAYVDKFRQVGDRLREAAALMFVGVARTCALDLTGAEEALRAAESVGLAIGSVAVVDAARWRAGQVWYLRGDPEGAEAILAPIVATDPAGVRGGSITVLYALVQEAAGDPSRARALLERVVASPTYGPAARGEALEHLGRLGSGDPSSARARREEALAIATEHGLGHLECRVLANLARDAGDDPARAWLERGWARAAEMGSPPWPVLDLTLAETELSVRAGAVDAARAHLGRISVAGRSFPFAARSGARVEVGAVPPYDLDRLRAVVARCTIGG